MTEFQARKGGFERVKGRVSGHHSQQVADEGLTSSLAHQGRWLQAWKGRRRPGQTEAPTLGPGPESGPGILPPPGQPPRPRARGAHLCNSGWGATRRGGGRRRPGGHRQGWGGGPREAGSTGPAGLPEAASAPRVLRRDGAVRAAGALGDSPSGRGGASAARAAPPPPPPPPSRWTPSGPLARCSTPGAATAARSIFGRAGPQTCAFRTAAAGCSGRSSAAASSSPPRAPRSRLGAQRS